jgi:hypothetical protein
MNLTEMRAIVRRDLHDEDAGNYRWTDNEIDRHILHAVKDYSEAVPLEQKASITTVESSREIDISVLTGRITVEAVEYPVDKFPKRYQRFSIWADTLTLLGNEIPDGLNAYIYYGKLHSLDVSGSTILAWHEDLVAGGACAYAALEQSVYVINKVNSGGIQTQNDFLRWGKEKLDLFEQELTRLSRKNRIRVRSLYQPDMEIVNQSTDFGPR